MTGTGLKCAAAAMVVSLLGWAGTAEAQDLSDAQVAHVAVTANGIDADLAKLALQQSSNEAVRAFAQMMIDDHTGVNEAAGALVKKLGVTPAPNEVSTSLQQGADEAKTSLKALSGAAFDRGYMTREVAYHEAVLDALDGLLIPTSQNAELRKLLETVRPAIAAHLERARQIRQSLGR